MVLPKRQLNQLQNGRQRGAHITKLLQPNKREERRGEVRVLIPSWTYTREVFCVQAPQVLGKPKRVTNGSNFVIQANIYRPSYNVDAVINGHQETMLIDTGTVVSLLTEEFVKKHIGIDKMIYADDLRLTSSLATASGDVLPCV